MFRVQPLTHAEVHILDQFRFQVFEIVIFIEKEPHDFSNLFIALAWLKLDEFIHRWLPSLGVIVADVGVIE